MRTLKKEVWPYQVFVKVPAVNMYELVALDKWCGKTIGQRFRDWYSYNSGDGTRIYAFKDEATVLIFKLTWGNYGTW